MLKEKFEKTSHLFPLYFPAGKPAMFCIVSRLHLGGGVGYRLSRDKALRKLAAAIFYSAKVVGGKSTAMDSKGNKVLVCDNGTGVSSISCYIAGNVLYLPALNHFVHDCFAVRQVRICRLELSSSYLPFDGGQTDY